MTEHLPDEITYGFVADRVLLAVGDTTDDADRFPDGVPAKGTITFTPERDTHYTQQTPATVLQQPIECTIYQGDPDDPEEPPDRVGMLVDPAGHVGNVALVVGWYSVSYRLDRGAAKRFRFQVRPEHTADEPLWLSSVAPLTPSPSERFVVNEKVYTETLAARDKTKEYRDQAQTARTGAETAETNAKTHATDAASSASSAADILTATEALGITVDTSVGTRVFVGDTMIYGDTGWRDVTSDVSVHISGNVYIKRTERVTIVNVEDLIRDGSGTTTIMRLPYGYRESTRAQGEWHSGINQPVEGDFILNSNGYLIAYGVDPQTPVSFTAHSPTSSDQPWPTSLPGLPA